MDKNKKEDKVVINLTYGLVIISFIIVLISVGINLYDKSLYIENGGNSSVYIIVSLLGSVASFLAFFLSRRLSKKSDEIIEDNTELTKEIKNTQSSNLELTKKIDENLKINNDLTEKLDTALKQIKGQYNGEQLIEELNKFFVEIKEGKYKEFIAMTFTSDFGYLFDFSDLTKELKKQKINISDSFSDISTKVEHFYVATIKECENLSNKQNADDRGVHNFSDLAQSIWQLKKAENQYVNFSLIDTAEVGKEFETMKLNHKTEKNIVIKHTNDAGNKFHYVELDYIPFLLFIAKNNINRLSAWVVYVGSYNIEGLLNPSGQYLTDSNLVKNLISVFGTLTKFDVNNDEFKKSFGL